MIKLGTQNISALRLGGQEIKKAYLEEALVLRTEKKPSRLPEGYREVEYVLSDSDCGIDTGVKGVNYAATRIVIEIKPDPFKNNGVEYIIGKTGLAYPTNSTFYWLGVWRNTATQIRYRYYTNTAVSKTLSLPESKITVDFNFKGKKLIVGSSEFSISNYSFNTSTISKETNIFLLSHSTTQKSISAKLYSAQIYFNGTTLTRDFVPCINPSGAVGLYDLVGSKFYGNAGTGVLSAGPAV